MPRPTPAPKKGSPLLPLYILLGLVALAGVFFLVTQLRKSKGTLATEPVAVNMTPEQLQRVPGIARGDANAPITIFEFADYTCPGCRSFTVFMEPMIRDSLVNTGKARFVFYDFPLGGGGHRHGFLAARAGRCANEQGKFWEMHDRLFLEQENWAFASDPAKLMEGFAGEVGLDGDAFSQCLRSDRFQREVSESKSFGEHLGVNSTPTLLVNGQRLPFVQNYAELMGHLRQIAPAAFAAAPAAPAADSAAPADSTAP